MLKNMFNQKGFSITEILISVGLMGAVSIGVMSLIDQSEKKKNELNHTMNRLTLEKMLETHLYSKQGCQDLKSKKIGDSVAFAIKNHKNQNVITFEAGKKLGRTEIESLRLGGFTATDSAGTRGLVKVILSMKIDEKGAVTGKVVNKDIPVPVNVVGGVIQDCQNQGKIFDEIMKQVCAGSFGAVSKDKNCPDAMKEVEKLVIKEICIDVYGDEAVKLNDFQCNLKLIHSKQSCGKGGKARGFDPQGKIKC